MQVDTLQLLRALTNGLCGGRLWEVKQQWATRSISGWLTRSI